MPSTDGGAAPVLRDRAAGRSPVSVLMSLYAKEAVDSLRQCLASLEDAIGENDEIVLVEDGPVGPALHAVVQDARSRLPIRSVRLPANVGLPGALNAGLAACSHELVARMDTDDLCLPTRFDRQVAYLDAHPRVAVVGAAVEEFDGNSDNVVAVRRPPCEPSALARYATMSSPLNQPAVMFRKSSVLEVGAYPVQFTVAFEDYFLWLRLLHAGHQLANIDDVLVRMRAGAPQANRRRGLQYARAEVQFAIECRRAGFFTGRQVLRFIALRVPFRFAPRRLLQVAYGKLARGGLFARLTR